MANDGIKCKLWGHSWDELPGPPPNVFVAGEDEFLRCVRCHTIRVIVISRFTGKVTYSRYIYPKEYKSLDTRLEYRREWYNAKKSPRRKAG